MTVRPIVTLTHSELLYARLVTQDQLRKLEASGTVESEYDHLCYEKTLGPKVKGSIALAKHFGINPFSIFKHGHFVGRGPISRAVPFETENLYHTLFLEGGFDLSPEKICVSFSVRDSNIVELNGWISPRLIRRFGRVQLLNKGLVYKVRHAVLAPIESMANVV